jgi:hypothetical protein
LWLATSRRPTCSSTTKHSLIAREPGHDHGQGENSRVTFEVPCISGVVEGDNMTIPMTEPALVLLSLVGTP